MSADLDAVYRERNLAVQLAAELAGRLGYQISWGSDPAAGSQWPVLSIELPTGQVSWHLPVEEAHAYAPLGRIEFDGHTTDEKHERVMKFIKRQDLPDTLVPWPLPDHATTEPDSTCPNCGCNRENDPLTPGCVACMHVLQDLLLLVEVFVPDDVVQHWEADRVNAATEWAASTHVNANDHDDVEVPDMPAFLASFREVPA